jgi:hypothetical protein
VARTLTEVQIAEALVMVLKQLEDLDATIRRKVLEEALKVCDLVEK